MTKIRIPFLMIFVLILFITGCSNDNSASSNDGMDRPSYDADDYYQGEESGGYTEGEPEGKNYNDGEMEVERQVVYEGYMTIETKELSKIKNNIELLVSQIGGYVIQSSIYDYGEENRSSSLHVRVPSKEFQNFLIKVEELSGKVIERTVRGQDVTEEYTDLEARLRAKEIVEKRLITFLEGAKKTEDLLRISNDLARIQQEIEQIKGRISYLKNHVDYASVTININERKVIVPEITKDDLNILERSKKAFVDSVNGILHLFSALIVGLIGFAPYLILIIVPTLFILFKALKKWKAKGSER